MNMANVEDVRTHLDKALSDEFVTNDAKRKQSAIELANGVQSKSALPINLVRNRHDRRKPVVGESQQLSFPGCFSQVIPRSEWTGTHETPFSLRPKPDYYASDPDVDFRKSDQDTGTIELSSFVAQGVEAPIYADRHYGELQLRTASVGLDAFALVQVPANTGLVVFAPTFLRGVVGLLGISGCEVSLELSVATATAANEVAVQTSNVSIINLAVNTIVWRENIQELVPIEVPIGSHTGPLALDIRLRLHTTVFRWPNLDGASVADFDGFVGPEGTMPYATEGGARLLGLAILDDTCMWRPQFLLPLGFRAIS